MQSVYTGKGTQYFQWYKALMLLSFALRKRLKIFSFISDHSVIDSQQGQTVLFATMARSSQGPPGPFYAMGTAAEARGD
jgi:hypothetical protein